MVHVLSVDDLLQCVVQLQPGHARASVAERDAGFLGRAYVATDHVTSMGKQSKNKASK